MKLLSPLLSRRRDDGVNLKFTTFKDHEEMANRLTKTLYYGKSPKTDRPSLAMTDAAVKLFAKAIPNGGLGEIDMHYAASVSRNACVSPCSLMLALVYIDRLRHCNPDYLQTVSSSEIFLVSMMIASKFLYDEGEEDEVFNDEWAASANLETKDINELERQFLSALDWNAFVDFISLSNILHRMESHIALQEGLKRGWFSYTDLEILSQNLSYLHCMKLLMDNVLKVAVVCTIAYIAGILTMVGSTIIVYRGIFPGCIKQLAQIETSNYAHQIDISENSSLMDNKIENVNSSSDLATMDFSKFSCDVASCIESDKVDRHQIINAVHLLSIANFPISHQIGNGLNDSTVSMLPKAEGFVTSVINFENIQPKSLPLYEYRNSYGWKHNSDSSVCQYYPVALFAR